MTLMRQELNSSQAEIGFSFTSRQNQTGREMSGVAKHQTVYMWTGAFPVRYLPPIQNLNQCNPEFGEKKLLSDLAGDQFYVGVLNEHAYECIPGSAKTQLLPRYFK